ncbi:MAG TPA: hypothetical protein VI653_20385, partial [Steroidobacteraceae bacterium]
MFTPESYCRILAATELTVANPVMIRSRERSLPTANRKNERMPDLGLPNRDRALTTPSDLHAAQKAS